MMKDPQSLALYDGLASMEKTALQVIVTSFATKPFDKDLVVKCADSMYAEASLEVGIIGLLRKGIIESDKESHDDFTYRVPRKHFPFWQQIVMGNLSISSEETKTMTSQIVVQMSDQLGLAHRLFQLCVYIAKHGLTLTSQHTLHQRDIAKLLRILSITSADFKVMPIGEAQNEKFPPALAVIYDMALKAGLIIVESRQVILDMLSLVKWFSLHLDEINQRLHQLWMETNLPDSVWNQHALFGLCSLPRDRWFSLTQLNHWVATQHIPDGGLDNEHQWDCFRKRWVTPLCVWGWGQLGVDMQGKEWFRWASADHANFSDKSLIIQPNYEIIAMLTIPYAVRWELECIAEHLHSDHTSRFQLTQASICQATADGRNAEEIIAFLKLHAKYEVPANVEIALKEWAGQQMVSGQRGQDGGLPRWEDHKLAEEVVKRVDSEKVREMTVRQVRDIYPGLPSIPGLWLQSFRKYHPSITREIISKAMGWKACITLLIRGQKVTMVPKGMITEGDEWSVQGWIGNQEERLPVNQIEEIQLILPGVNDGIKLVVNKSSS